MRKKVLFTRAISSIVCLILLGLLNVVILGVMVSEGQFPVLPFWGIVALDGIAYLTLSYLVFEYLILPYLEIKKIYQRFLDGQAYEELFDSEYEVLPNWKEVLMKMRHLLNKQDAIKMSKKQAEYLALQNQINPHFLYNTLEAIRGDAICAGMQSIAETTEALSIFFRYSITGVDRLVALEEEIDNVENYFTIQRYRFEEKVKLHITYPKEEKILQLKLPKLTVQPFVENAIYHGLEKKIEGGTVSVNIETTENKLMITVSDNGIGMREEQVEEINEYLDRVAVSYVGESRKKEGGIAMKNVNTRIKLLFGEEYGIHLYSVKNIGTDIKIILPKIVRGNYEERESAY